MLTMSQETLLPQNTVPTLQSTHHAIARSHPGNESLTLGHFYHEFFESLVKQCRSRGLPKEHAEDLATSVLLEAHKHLCAKDDDPKKTANLLLKWRLKDYFRGVRREGHKVDTAALDQQAVPGKDTSGLPGSTMHLTPEELHSLKALRQTVEEVKSETLLPEERIVYELREDEMTFEQISTTLTPGDVSRDRRVSDIARLRQRHCRAMKRFEDALRTRLAEECVDSRAMLKILQKID